MKTLPKDDNADSFTCHHEVFLIDTCASVQAEHQGLKKLCEDNDEDLFVYFEEYVEKSGPVFPKSVRFIAFDRFRERATAVFSRSVYNLEKKKSKKVEDDDDEVETEVAKGAEEKIGTKGEESQPDDKVVKEIVIDAEKDVGVSP